MAEFSTDTGEALTVGAKTQFILKDPGKLNFGVIEQIKDPEWACAVR